MNTSNDITTAMLNAGLNHLDPRGLMPLEHARSHVKQATEFRKGQGQMVGDQWVLYSDYLWAALLSLESTEEFVNEASRLRWFFHPRGEDNIAPFLRYGDGILNWLWRFVDQEGRLINVPWCIHSCLLQIGNQAGFDLAWRVRVVDDLESRSRHPGPFASDSPGDIDRYGPLQYAAVPPALIREGNLVFIEWLDRHLVAGMGRLVAIMDQFEQQGIRDHEDLRRAKTAVAAMVNADTENVSNALFEAVGDDRAHALLARIPRGTAPPQAQA